MNNKFNVLAYESDVEEDEVIPKTDEKTEVDDVREGSSSQSVITLHKLLDPEGEIDDSSFAKCVDLVMGILYASGVYDEDEKTPKEDEEYCAENFEEAYLNRQYNEVLKFQEEPSFFRGLGGLTIEGVCLNTIETARTSNPLLGDAMQYLYERMKRYHIVLPISKMGVKRTADFVKYLPPNCARFFTNECYHYEGSYQGEILSMWSWYFGRGEDGKPQYIYITTAEGYGSCSGCDSVLSCKDTLHTLKSTADLAMRKATEFANKGMTKEAEEQKEKCFKAVRLYRSTCEREVLLTFKRLKFFTTYRDAKKFITNRAEEHVDFKKHQKPLKKASAFDFRGDEFPELPTTSTKK